MKLRTYRKMLFNLFRFSLFKATVLALPTFPIFLTLISGYYARGIFFFVKGMSTIPLR